MKNLTRKLFISVAVLAVAVIAMSTSTFAWFTMSGTATVQTVTTTVDGGSGFLISSDGVKFGDDITLTNVYTGAQAAANTSYGAAPGDGTAFTPVNIAAVNPIFKTVTSVPASEGLAFQSLDGTADTNANVDYLDFTIWFTASAAATPVYLKNVAVISPDVNFHPLADFTHKTVNYGPATSDIDVNAANAVRLSMKNSKSGATQIINGPQIISGSSVGDLGSTYNDASAAITDFASVAYYNAVMNTGLTATQGPDLDYTYVSGATQIISLDVSNKTAQFVTFRLWLEGWDGDAFDAIRGKQITLDISFTSDVDNAMVL